MVAVVHESAPRSIVGLPFHSFNDSVDLDDDASITPREVLTVFARNRGVASVEALFGDA